MINPPETRPTYAKVRRCNDWVRAGGKATVVQNDQRRRALKFRAKAGQVQFLDAGGWTYLAGRVELSTV